MPCLAVAEVQEAFARSNLPRELWPQYEEWLDEMELQEGFRVTNIREFSVVDLHIKPDGSSMGAEQRLLGVCPGIGLVILQKVGGRFRKPRVDPGFMVFSDTPGIAFFSDDRQHGRDWGEYAVQGVLPGGQPAVRIGWPWSGRAREPHRQPAAAAGERDRILRFLPHP